jgi:hypothetical protein
MPIYKGYTTNSTVKSMIYALITGVNDYMLNPHYIRAISNAQIARNRITEKSFSENSFSTNAINKVFIPVIEDYLSDEFETVKKASLMTLELGG